jgi:hypothetical protein
MIAGLSPLIWMTGGVSGVVVAAAAAGVEEEVPRHGS